MCHACGCRVLPRAGVQPTREWFAAHRDAYERDVRAPLEGLLEQLGGSWRVYRPYRDVRFSRDKEPIKRFAGAVAEQASGTGRFVRIDVRGLFVSSGLPMPARDQLVRLRAALADDGTGSAFGAAVAEVEASWQAVTPGRFAPLRGTPRGFRADHPRIGWLRWKGVEMPTLLGPLDWGVAAARAVGAWAAAAPVDDWLGRHVGPSSLSPQERYGRGPR